LEIQSLEVVSVVGIGDYNLHGSGCIMTENILEEMLQVLKETISTAK
jgi:hypothetical protein